MNNIKSSLKIPKLAIDRPTIYLAGKIGKNDWRQELIPGLRDQTWSDGPIYTENFTYMGPFFRACDHGCGHYPGSHGMIQECAEPYYTGQDVVSLNMGALAKSDLVLAYITAADCHGSIFEVGWAVANGKRVVMAFAPDIETHEFWFSSMQCAKSYQMVNQHLLPEILTDEVNQIARMKV